MTHTFATPAAPSTGIKFGDYLGRLLLVEPSTVETGIQTSFGLTDAIRCTTVVVLDGPDAGTEYPDTLIFPKILQSQLRPQIGQKVLGRVTQGNAKPGQSPPWMLTEATPEDIELGNRWLNRPGQTATPAPAPDGQTAKVPF